MGSSERSGWHRVHVSRPRLLSRLSDATRCKVTLVCAGPGYGKSTLLLDYIQTAGISSGWYRLSALDRDPTHLAAGLADCLAQISSRPVERPNPGPVDPGTLGILCQGLLRQMLKPKDDFLLLVLDDYDSVDQSGDAAALIQMLIEESPDFVHFAILSRKSPHLPLGRLRAQQQLSELGQEELVFKLDETFRMLRHGESRELTDGQITLVHDRMEGWAAGIATVYQSLRYGRKEQLMQLLADRAGPARLVYDYLAQEVFDCQDAATQDFLVKTSILTKMDFEACDWLLERDSSLQTLLGLENGGLFTTAVDAERRTFRYHELFRQFLHECLHARFPPETIRALHRRAAAFYEGRRDWVACVHHLLRAGETVRAAEVVESTGEKLIFSGFSQTVEFWLATLPRELVAKRPWLLALRGRLAHMSVKNEEAERLLDRALQLFQAQGDEYGQAWATGELAYVDFRSGALTRSIQRFAEALSRVKQGSLLESELLTMQAMAYRLAGRLDDSIEGCMASLRQLSGVDDEAFRNWGQSRATRNLALALMERGELEAAHATARRALSFCIEMQLGQYEEGWVLASLGSVIWAMGDLQGAIQAFERAMSLSGRYVKHLQHFISPWWGNSLRDAGRLEEAEEIYSMGTGVAELERVFADVLCGRAGRVRSVAEALYQRHCQSEGVATRAVADIVQSAVLRACGEPLHALIHATRAVDLLRVRGHRQRLASALLHKARLEYESSQREAARASLREAFKLAHSGGYYHFYWWDPQAVAFLCAQALADDLALDYIGQLLGRRPDMPRAAVLSPLLQSHQVRAHRLAISVLGSLSDWSNGLGESLASCPDPGIIRRLIKAIEDRVISASAIHILRQSHGLSWREVDVFVEYYLRPATETRVPDVRWRAACAGRPFRIPLRRDTGRAVPASTRRRRGRPKLPRR